MTDHRPLHDALAVVGLGLLAVAGFAWLQFVRNVGFSHLFGAVSPLAIVILAVVAGAGLRLLLGRLGWPPEAAPDMRNNVLLFGAAWLAVFCLVATATDLVFHFPADMNVPAPDSLVYYPSVALVAEIAFHLAPLALVFSLMTLALPRMEPGLRATCSAAIVALIEPVFQVLAASDDGASPLREAITFANVYGFGLVQLHLFRRRGFLAMYGFRLAYYAWWHVAWGALRLGWIST